MAYLEWKKNVEGEAVESELIREKEQDWSEEEGEGWLEREGYEESLKESEEQEDRSHLLINFAVIFVCTDHHCVESANYDASIQNSDACATQLKRWKNPIRS